VRNTAKLLLAAIVGLTSGCGDYEPERENRFSRNEDRANALVLRYCLYGARSVPDLEVCIRRITPQEVRRDGTNAGRYATGEVGRCREDSGPYCRAADDP
jgi:hypothetical protein